MRGDLSQPHAGAPAQSSRRLGDSDSCAPVVTLQEQRILLVEGCLSWRMMVPRGLEILAVPGNLGPQSQVLATWRMTWSSVSSKSKGFLEGGGAWQWL